MIFTRAYIVYKPVRLDSKGSTLLSPTRAKLVVLTGPRASDAENASRTQQYGGFLWRHIGLIIIPR